MSTNITDTLLFSMIIAFSLSLIITATYYYVNRKYTDSDMMLTLLLLPIVVCAIIFTIGENIAGAFSLAGIFTIVRFRSTQASPKDITYILIGVAAGLTSATHFFVEGIFLIIFCIIIIIVYEKLNNEKTSKTLKILIPEDLINNYDIEKVLKKYTNYYVLEAMQTKDLGSLFELIYKIGIPNQIEQKEMIDELRVINGNLTIKITK